MSERKYSAMRIEPGLYLQPSNDGERRYVIMRYEDGRIYGLVDGPQRVTYWSWREIDRENMWRIERMAQFDVEQALIDLRDYARGHRMACPSKRAAVEEALDYDDAKEDER
jgi:hypothetical protein